MGLQRVGHAWSHLAWHAPGVSGDFSSVCLRVSPEWQEVGWDVMGTARRKSGALVVFSSEEAGAACPRFPRDSEYWDWHCLSQTLPKSGADMLTNAVLTQGRSPPAP